MLQNSSYLLLADATTLVAWWGAVVATLVLFWDVYKWATSGARIRMTVRGNMRTMGDPPLDGKTYVMTEAANVGESPTTLEKMGLTFYLNRWQRLWRKPAQQFFVKNPGRLAPFPYKLEIGETWTGFTHQTQEISDLARQGLLYCNLYYSSRKRPISTRVTCKANECEEYK